MQTKPLLVGAALGLLALGTGLANAAKPPAYTFDQLGFTTWMKGVPEGERRAECLDKGCSERGGVVVAEGKTTSLASPITITIREHKHKAISKNELSELSKKLLAHAPRGKQVRSVSGQVAGRPSLEQWSIVDGCQRTIAGRVFVSMPDKIIEVETLSTLEPGHELGDSSIGAMTKILQKLRVRRLGNATLDPADEPISVKQMASAMPKTCER